MMKFSRVLKVERTFKEGSTYMVIVEHYSTLSIKTEPFLRRRDASTRFNRGDWGFVEADEKPGSLFLIK